MSAAKLSVEQLKEAARMRNEDGAAWGVIRVKFGVKTSSGTFLKLWDAAGIAYRPSGEPKLAKAVEVEPAKAKATKTTTAKATAPAKVTRKPRVSKAAPGAKAK